MTTPTLDTIVVPLAELKPDPDNSREHDRRNIDEIKFSLTEFGQRKAIVIMPDRTVIAGNGTLEAATELGWEGLACHVVPEDWSIEKAMAFAIVDNRSAELAGWNGAKLAQSLTRLEAAGFDAAALGFNARERRAFGDRLKVDTAEDEIPEAPPYPTARAGQVWALGRHRLACGDSRDGELVNALLDGEPVDFLFTSPPYNVGKPYRSHVDRGSWDEYADLLAGVLGRWVPHLAEGRVVAWNIGTAPATRPGAHFALLEDAGLDYWRTLIWNKVGVPIPLFHRTRNDPKARHFTPDYTHELVLLFARGERVPGGPVVRDLDPAYAHRWIGLFTKGPAKEGGPVEFGTALEHDTFSLPQNEAGREVPADDHEPVGSNLETRKRKAHPAPFPVALPGAFIAHLADVDAIVADPFAGVGSTIIACEQLGRRGYGIELDPRYCDVAIARWQQSTGLPATLLTDIYAS